ncbi:nuclear transport factor 2 family protein [Streptomyces sp. NPDC046939]|uniref:nuclear transport factor 2 family protein n=1 Tax=Streptomyces sp. NPDC046939 TaxID=3155376 RepID=UPI0033E8EFDE
MHAETAGFYAHQMRRLDEGDAEGWAATFTEDAVFRISSRRQPMRGRAELTAGARAASDAVAAAGERLRHMTGMLEIEELPDEQMLVRATTLVYATDASGGARLHQVCDCTDILVRTASAPRTFLVKDRRIDVLGHGPVPR